MKSPDTVAKLLRTLERELGPHLPITSITPEKIVELVGRFKSYGNSNSTINKKLVTLSKLLKHAHQLGIIPSVPKMPRYKESLGRVRFFSKAEEQALLSRAEQLGLVEMKYMIQFLIYTGARRSEMHRSEKRDRNKKLNTVTFWDTKSGDSRSIPLSAPAAEALDWAEAEYPDQSRFFPMSYNTFTGYWQRLRADLGFSDDPQFVPHACRHTTASRLVQSGVDLRRVQAFMGHKGIQMTLRYAHLAPTDLQLAAQALSN